MTKKTQAQKKAERRVQTAIKALTCAELRNQLFITEAQYTHVRALLVALIELKECPPDEPQAATLFGAQTDYRARLENPLQPKLFKGWKWYEES